MYTYETALREECGYKGYQPVSFGPLLLPHHPWATPIYLESTSCPLYGIDGYIQYWDWPKYAAAPQDSPIFNGDPYSLGGNGAWDLDLPASLITLPEGVTGDPFTLPRGVGGGYVTTGPFANLTVNLGPIADLPGLGVPKNPQADGLGYNPRRVKRDLGPAINKRYANYTTVFGECLFLLRGIMVRQGERKRRDRKDV